MTGHRSRLVQAAAALVLLTTSALLWLPLGASSTHASALHALPGGTTPSPTAVCPTPGNNACIITQIPTVVLTLSGKDQTIPYVLTFTLNNTTFGNWHVAITSTQFTTGSHTLAVNASNVTAVASASACSGTCPNNTIPYPVNIVAGTPVTFYDNTGSSHGNGTFTIQATINVVVPANTYIGTYTCTVTISFQSGP